MSRGAKSRFLQSGPGKDSMVNAKTCYGIHSVLPRSVHRVRESHADEIWIRASLHLPLNARHRRRSRRRLRTAEATALKNGRTDSAPVSISRLRDQSSSRGRFRATLNDRPPNLIDEVRLSSPSFLRVLLITCLRQPRRPACLGSARPDFLLQPPATFFRGGLGKAPSGRRGPVRGDRKRPWEGPRGGSRGSRP